jgi:hypothetical protein
MRRTVVVVALLLGFAASSADAVVRDVRLLVVRLTWGPPVQTVAQVQSEVAAADAFVRRSSFGRATLRADLTPVISGFVVPRQCYAGANRDNGLGALSVAARAAAASLGFDLSAYDRFVYVFPDTVCGAVGVGIGRDVMIAHPTGLSSLGLVHELGHTFGLPHASSALCANCAIREYGDLWSVMGLGTTDFGAWEKAQLGWIDTIRRVSASGTYELAPVDTRPQDDRPQALLLRVTGGTLWIERRQTPSPTILIRIVKRPPCGGATRAIYLTVGRDTASVPGLVNARSLAGGRLVLTRLDRP